ncbi:hypothetical protein [Alkalihalobacillus sp. LMS39]|uniref:LiaF transmembrane domain-containing protein n=1 Tax=Alkalihalobacillus sp. LMS39 TaxID=2924032 RepID=UPI001FB21571|nr:hypothetical protein [Alkalihalobacillus sp. LMS39]UOE95506.1 hypothetical protein MM271_07830 [Alkalihalobacillus sp. LMS39]
MNWTGKVVFGAILIVIGANLFLSTLGIHLGGVIGLLIAGLFILWGFSKRKHAKTNGSKIMGTIILIFGILLLIGKAHMIGGILIAAVIIYFGYSLVREDKGIQNQKIAKEEVMEPSFESMATDDAFEHEWKKFIEKHN